MKKTIFAIIVGIFLCGTVSAAYVHEKGDWGDWWNVGNEITSVKRIYDHENKLVCWLFYGYSGNVAIDCQPSLELEHPMTICPK